MDYMQLKEAVKKITLPEDIKNRIVYQTSVKSSSRYRMVWKKTIATAAAAIIFVTCGVPALCANIEPIYNIMYRVSPSLAQYFKLIQKSDEDNGIKMEVVSAYVHENTAQIYITMQDLTSDRIDETADLADSYYIHSAFDTMASCQYVDYDAETKTATLMVTITQIGEKSIQKDKITFSVNEFFSGKKEYKDVEIPVDLKAARETDETQRVYLLGGCGEYEVDWDSFEVLLPGTPEKSFPIDGFDFTAMGFIDGVFHVQVAIQDSLNNDNNSSFYLLDENGDKIESAVYSFAEETPTGRTGYEEHLFFVTPEKLEQCTLYGDFWTTNSLTKGKWSVTFSI